MNVPKGKPSISPPAQIAHNQARNIVSRGQTPPSSIRNDYTGIVDPQGGYSIGGFAGPANLPHEMNKQQSVASGHLQQPGLAPNTYTAQMRPQQTFYSQQQQAAMRSSRSYMQPTNQNQSHVLPMMFQVNPSQGSYTSQGLIFPPQVLGYSQAQAQRVPNPPQYIPGQPQFQQYTPPSQQYAQNAMSQQQFIYCTQQMPGVQPRPAQPSQAPVKRERAPITIVDPTTQKDVTDEILHPKSSTPQSSGTPVSDPVNSAIPPPQEKIRAQFALQVAATLGTQSPKQQSSTPPSAMAASASDSATQPEGTTTADTPTIVAREPRETSVDPPSLNDATKGDDPVKFEANEYNVNIAPSQPKTSPAVPKSVSVSAGEALDKKEATKPVASDPPATAVPQVDTKPDSSQVKSAPVVATTTTKTAVAPPSSQKASVSVSGGQAKQAASVSVAPPKESPIAPVVTEKVATPQRSEVSANNNSSTNAAPQKPADQEPVKDKPAATPPVVEEAGKKSTPPVNNITTATPTTTAPAPVSSKTEKQVDQSKSLDSESKVKTETKKEKTEEIKNGSVSKETTQERPDKTNVGETKKPDQGKNRKTEEEPVKTEKENSAPAAPAAPAPVIPVVDNKDEKVPEVEIKIEDVDVSKENAKNNEMTSEALNSESTNNKKGEMQLQYKYKADQWSPLNPEGKMIYDRDFLLQLQFSGNSISKPQGLPNLPDIILDKPQMASSKNLNDMGNTVRDFTPDFFQNMPGRTGSSTMIKKRNSLQAGARNEPKKIIKTLSISQDVKLHKAENAWEPGRRVEKEKSADDAMDADETKTQLIYKKVKSILNKLTPQKFQTLLKQVQELDIDSETRLKGVTDLIFEKAVSEPAFSVAYANMCRYLMQLKVPSDTKAGEKVNFRVILLTKCQREFEKDKDVEIDLEARQKKIDEAESEDEKKTLQEEMEIAATTARRRSIGNIRFIGELFKLKMLTENIMHDCVFKLLRSRDEENLECLCRLLTTIGKELDTEKAKPRVDQYFTKMQKIVAERKTSCRVRFMLQDVIDLRLCNWVPRREDNNPKTIDQIHKEAAKESAQKAYLLSQAPPPSNPSKQGGGGGSRSRGGPPNRQQNNQRNDDGWNTVASKPLRNIDLSKMKITKTTVDENIQLGPGGGSSRFGVWGRGSSGGGHGTKNSSQEGESPASANIAANRFTALRPEEENRPFGRGISPARNDSRNRGQGGFGRGRLTARSSQEADRGMANIRNLGRVTSSSSNPASRENSRSRDQRQDKADEAVPKALSSDEMEKKTKTIVDEYLHIDDIKEACLCVSEINNPETVHLFIEFSINHVLERSSIARQATGHLHHELVSRKLVSVDSYLKGLSETLQIAEDMEIDIPKIWQYLGELIGPMIQDGSVPLSFLTQACRPLQESGKAGILVAAILHDASNRLGHKKVASLWKNSGLQWSDFVPQDKVQQFLADKNLEFTVAADSQPTTPIDKVSFETIQEQLLVRLQPNFENEHIFDWIEDNIPDESTKSPKFIRTLMTAVCKSAVNGANSKFNPNVIKQRQSLLLKYLDNQPEFEIQALYALQAFVNSLQHPPGVLRSFFDKLYDEDVISEDAFNQWANSTDPAEQEGKGVAMKQVVQFFAWLKEGEQEES